LVGCKGSDKQDAPATDAPAAKASVGVVDTKCPMMLSHAAGTKVVVDFEGQKVGMCCKGCLPAWNKLTDEQKAEKLKAAM
jgi:hypothetical protein